MSNRVGEPQDIGFCPIDSGGLLIILQCGTVVSEISLNFAKTSQRFCQIDFVASLAAESDRLDQITLRIVRPMFSSRLNGAPAETLRYLCHIVDSIPRIVKW